MHSAAGGQTTDMDEELQKPVMGVTGRIYRSFGTPTKQYAALEAAKRHVDKARKPISIQHRLGFIHFQRLKDQDYFEEVVHPEAVHYPSIHKTRQSVPELLGELEVNVKAGLNQQKADEILQQDIELDKGDILAGLVAVGDGGEKAGLELSLERDVERVKREGLEHTLHALDLVKGDVIRLQTGDVLPTDACIVSVLARPCIIARRNVPDYADFISPTGMPEAAELEKMKREKGQQDQLKAESFKVRESSSFRNQLASGLASSSSLANVDDGFGAPSPRRVGSAGGTHQRSLHNAQSHLRDAHEQLHSKINAKPAGAGPRLLGMGTSRRGDIGGIKPDGSFRMPKQKLDSKIKLTRQGLKRRQEPKPRERWSTEGWDSGVRACMPVAFPGALCHHGDVVQWGECLAVCTQPPKQSSWSSMWRRVLRVRAIRAKELSDEADAAIGAKDQNYEFKTMKRLKALSKMGLNITHAATAKVLGDVTCVVLEDDFRFRPSYRSDGNDAGIGVGVTADEEEFRYRYKDLLGLATRTGIAVCVMVRHNSVTEVDVARLSRWLRLPVVSASNGSFDHCTRPLRDLFVSGGGIVLVDSKLSSASELVDAIQRCDAKGALATYKKHTVDAIRNPHGVLSHMLSTGVAELDKNIVENMAPPSKAKETERAEADKARALMNAIIQDDEEQPRHQLVAFVGEDWAALAAADVGVTWHSSLSPGAYEAQKLACVTLAENSPSRMLQAMSEYEMNVHSGSSGSGCVIA